MHRNPLPTALLAAILLLLVLPAPARGADGWRWPVDGPVISAFRNGDDPYAAGQHRGIDIAAPDGTTVGAATDGTVTFAGSAGDSGLTVAIRTAGGHLDTSYLHLGSVAVARGQAVRGGDPLGTVGATGRRSTAEPHLHFGVRAAGERHGYVDPLSLLPPAVPAPRPPRAVPVAVPEPRAPLIAPPLPARLEPMGPAKPALGPGAAPFPGPVPGRPPAPAVPAAPAGLGAVPALTPAPVQATDRARALAPGPARAIGPAAVRRLRPAPAPAARHAVPRPGRSAAAAARSSAGSSPSRGPAARSARRPDPAAHPPRAIAMRPPITPRSANGLDLGWLAACAALIAVAGLLARPRGPAGGFRRASSIAPWPTTSRRRSTT